MTDEPDSQPQDGAASHVEHELQVSQVLQELHMLQLSHVGAQVEQQGEAIARGANRP